ncbi:MAG: hypothetical protein LBK99_11210 [Opitutaceae bacterium]|jgi:hypothetical protein|nr:hypothetical protein [Opitutaceae bacterium]
MQPLQPLQTMQQQSTNQTRTGARPPAHAFLRVIWRGLLAPGALAAAVLSESAASSIQDLGLNATNFIGMND